MAMAILAWFLLSLLVSAGAYVRYCREDRNEARWLEALGQGA